MPTSKTVIGQFENSQSLDIFQTLGQGGEVVCGMDYTGATYPSTILPYASGGNECAWPFQGVYTFPSLTFANTGTLNPTAGDFDIYTVPAGSRAFFVGSFNNPTANTITYYPEIKISGTYYHISGVGTPNAGISGAMNYGYIAEAGETFAINTAATAFVLTQVVPNTALTPTITAVAASSGGTAVYTTNASLTASQCVGFIFVVTGCAAANNNGTFICTANGTGANSTITLSNAYATAASGQTGTATSSTANAGFIGTITSGASNVFAGHTFTTAGFTNSGNNTSVTALASATTCFGGAVTSPVAETHAGTATDQATMVVNGTILLFSATQAPNVRTVKLTSLSAGNNTLYTCPAGKTCYIGGFSTIFNTSGSAGVNYINNSGSARTIMYYLVRSGGSPGLTNCLYFSAVNGIANLSVGPAAISAVLTAGDSIVINTDSAASGQVAYISVWEF